MSRLARRISETGMYHVMFQGVGKQNIFKEEADYQKLKEILHRVKDETQIELYAYCFMANRVHLFIREQTPGDISLVMKKILAHYATWFNKKYKRAGALFDNRYKSEPVEGDEYIYGLCAYIHQAPERAKKAKSVAGYEYSSYREYVENNPQITDIDFLLDSMSEDRSEAISQFTELCSKKQEDDYEISNTKRCSSGTARRIIKSELDGAEPRVIKELPKDQRDAVLKKLVKEKGISKSEIIRETGISRYIIMKACGEIRQKPLRPRYGKAQEKSLPAHLM